MNFIKIGLKNYSKINLVMPNLKNISLNIKENAKFADLEKELKELKFLEKIEFRTWDHSQISKGNDLSTYFENNNMFFYRYDQLEWQIVSKDNIDSLKHYNKLESIIHVDEFQELKKLVSNFNKNKKLTDEQIFDICLNLYRIRNVNEIKQTNNISELFNEYYKLKTLFAKLNKLNDGYLYSAEIRTRLLIFLAGLFFVIELGLIYYTTFVLYTWDITEPMTYLLGCFNMVLLLSLRKKFGNSSAFDYYVKKFYSSIIKKNKFDNRLLQDTSIRIKEIENIIN